MNYAILLIHIAALIGFIAVAYKMGKGALTCLGVTQAVLANLFVIKQIELFGCTITCADAYSVGAIFTLGLLQNRYGRESGIEMVRCAFLCLILFGVMSQLHLWYVPSHLDWTQGAFQTLFTISPRLIVASLVAFYVSSRLDVELFGFLRKKIPVWLALPFSVICTQTLDTLLFSFLGLFGVVGAIVEIFIISLAAKLVAIGAMALGTEWVRRRAV